MPRVQQPSSTDGRDSDDRAAAHVIGGEALLVNRRVVVHRDLRYSGLMTRQCHRTGPPRRRARGAGVEVVP